MNERGHAAVPAGTGLRTAHSERPAGGGTTTHADGGDTKDGGVEAARRPTGSSDSADPVKALLHRHRDLCERAVDPLEIAARLEAHGMNDRAAARFRHRDVFSLAEELYARVPRADEAWTPERGAADPPGAHAGWAVLALLPVVLCTATVAGTHLTEGRPRLATAAVGAAAVLLGVRASLRRGPLRAPAGPRGGTHVWTCWLLGYALCGDGVLSSALVGGPDGPRTPATAPVLALTLACAPALWCAGLLAAHARRGLAASRSLKEFAGSVRPLLLGLVAVWLCALIALLALCGAVLHQPAAYVGAGSLGALLLLARFLTVHGRTRVSSAALGVAGAAEATALATVLAGRLPGCSFLVVPVESAVDLWGPGVVPGLACGPAALVLLIQATRTLTRASAHASPPRSP